MRLTRTRLRQIISEEVSRITEDQHERPGQPRSRRRKESIIEPEGRGMLTRGLAHKMYDKWMSKFSSMDHTQIRSHLSKSTRGPGTKDARLWAGLDTIDERVSSGGCDDGSVTFIGEMDEWIPVLWGIHEDLNQEEDRREFVRMVYRWKEAGCLPHTYQLGSVRHRPR